MNTTYTFTPQQLWSLFLGMCAAIVSISAAGAVIYKWVAKLRAPNEEQNRKLAEHSKKLEEHDKALRQASEDHDALVDLQKQMKKHNGQISEINDHLAQNDKGIHVVLRALLAMISNAIDGSDGTALREAKGIVEGYLIDNK